jgi:hypothetical protein
MKKFLLALGLIFTLVSCRQSQNDNRYNDSQVYVNDPAPSTISVTPTSASIGANLDLQGLGELVKTSQTAQEIESKLNSDGSINNLDLNNDGSVDYIKVTEYGDGNNKGFSFTVDLPNNETQEVATIQIARGDGGAQMNIQGNQQLYGNNNNYQSHYSLGDLMIMNYLFTYHRPYYSPYRYGYYPRSYHSYRSVPMNSYRSRVSTTTRTSTITRTTRPSQTASRISSPNANKVSSAVSARSKSMAAPTRSQKSFTSTSANRSRPTTSGFGSRSRSSSSSASSSSSRSRSSFGSSSRSSSRSSGSRSSSRSSSRRR